MVGPFPDGTIDFIGFIRNNKHRFLLVTLVQCLNDLRAAELVNNRVQRNRPAEQGTCNYFFFYLGVSNSPGGRASILDSLGTFLLILAAAVVFREKLTLRSIFGCLLGFSGIVLINLGSTAGQFTLSGDGMLLCSSVCAMAGGLLTRVVTRKMDPLVATGHSLALGGALLIPAGLLMGAHPVGVHLKGLLILAALVAVSAVGFSFYNQLLRYHPVGQIAIYNAFIPVLGVVLSCLLLGEPFSWRYLLSGALVTVGICAVNLPGKGKN